MAETIKTSNNDDIKETIMSNEDWLKRWDDNNTSWHNDEPHFYLTRFFDTHLKVGDQPLNILVPLCGKSVDMIWLAKQGCHTYGIECAEKAAKEFFKTNELTYNEKIINEECTICTANELPITFVKGDFFALQCFDPFDGVRFDAVWDRGSFVAINTEDRQKYCDIILSYMRPGGVSLLTILDFDKTKHGGPPHATTLSDMQNLWERSNISTVQQLASEESKEKEKIEKWGLESMLEDAYLVRKL